VNEENLVQRVGVRTGTPVDRLRVVEEGLTDKDWIVIKGVQKATPGRRVTPDKQNLADSVAASSQTPGSEKGGP